MPPIFSITFLAVFDDVTVLIVTSIKGMDPYLKLSVELKDLSLILFLIGSLFFLKFAALDLSIK